ncbi:ORF20 [Silurid herpesvirus 1]|nr:ORF20 [Silurid herpesvirus 1]
MASFAYDKFPLFCCVHNCTYRVALDRVQPFMAHLCDHFGRDSRGLVRFRCPRCETILCQFPLDEPIPDGVTLKRAWNHVSQIQNECTAPGVKIMCVHFVTELVLKDH